MKNIINYLLTRLKERSTWLGLVSLAAAAGLTLSSGESEAIVAAGVAVTGLVAVFMKDK